MHHSRFLASSRLLALPLLAALAHGQAPTDIPYYATGVSAPNCTGMSAYGPMQSLDVHLPAGGFSQPMTILYLHPGGWSGGDKTEAQFFVGELVQRGYAVVAANYTLTCQGSDYAQAIRDARAALAWIQNRGTQLFALSDCIAVVGVSAGAQLAAMVGVLGDSNEAYLMPINAYPCPTLTPQCVVSISTPVDFYRFGLEGGGTQSCPPPGDCKLTLPKGYQMNPYAGFVQTYLRCNWNDACSAAPWPCTFPPYQWNDLCLPADVLTGNPYIDASPIHWVSPGDPPFYLIYSSCDRTVPGIESVWLGDALTSVGGTPVLQDVPSHCYHAFKIFSDSEPPVPQQYQTDAAIAVDAALRSGFANCP